MAKLIHNSLIHTYKGWEVIQQFYDNDTDNFSAFRNREPIKNEQGEQIFTKTPSEMDSIIDDFSDWGGFRQGAGRPATGSMPNRSIRMTDDEYLMVKEYLALYRGTGELDKLVREMVEQGWKMFSHEHPTENSNIDVVNTPGEKPVNVIFQQKYLYKNNHVLGTCVLFRFWKYAQ